MGRGGSGDEKTHYQGCTESILVVSDGRIYRSTLVVYGAERYAKQIT